MNPYAIFNHNSSGFPTYEVMNSCYVPSPVVTGMQYDAFNWWEIKSETASNMFFVPILQVGITTSVINPQELIMNTSDIRNLNDFCMWNLTEENLGQRRRVISSVYDEYYEPKLSAWSVPPSPGVDFNQALSNQMFWTKKEINMKYLKDFRYETRVDYNEFGKHCTVYIWKEGDWNKEFYRTNNLLDHVRMHAGIRPYTWQYWQKEFTQKSNMKKHMKMHLMPNLEQRKRYQWNQCGAWYTERYNFVVRKVAIIFIILENMSNANKN